MVVDSGACDSVIPSSLMPQVPVNTNQVGTSDSKQHDTEILKLGRKPGLNDQALQAKPGLKNCCVLWDDFKSNKPELCVFWDVV